MESSSSKMEIIKPVVLKAGIPMAVTLAGFVLAKIVTRRYSPPKASSPPSKNRVNIQEIDSCEIFTDDHHEEVQSLVKKESFELQEEILGLKCKIEDFQDREWRLEKRFLYYQDSKEQEIVLMELHNKFMLEINRVEFLERDITLLEAEKQRFEIIVREYLEILRLLEFSRSENQQLRMRVKKLLRKTKEHCRILRKKSLLIESKETEILKNKIELKAKADCIRLMEDEIRELKLQTELLLREKNELSCNLRVAEESAKSKGEGEMTTIENDNQIVCELDRLQKDEASEVKELIYLRWRNACLRRELMSRNQEQQQNKAVENNFGGIKEIEEFVSDNELNRCNVGQSDSNLGLTTQNHDHSKRRKLIEKFKRWVEKEKHGKNKCFRSRSVSDGAYFSATKSCSSA